MSHGDLDQFRQDPNGYFEPNYPHDIGRALTHPEMDYNLDLIGEIIKGYRVMGTGPEGEMDLINDVDKVLKLYQVTAADQDLIDQNCQVGDYVWVPGIA